jgi:hypothetical protein
MRKPPWWWKDKRVRQAEQIKTFHKSRRSVARTMSKITPSRDPDAAPTLQQVRYAMQVAELEAIKAKTPRPNFSFSPQQVIAIYTQHDGEPGMWFRLDDGRIFSSTGEPTSTDPDHYEP